MNTADVAAMVIKDFNEYRRIDVERLAIEKSHLQTILGEVRTAELELAQLDLLGTSETNDVAQSNIRLKRAILSGKQAIRTLQVYEIKAFIQKIALLTNAIKELEMNPTRSIIIENMKNYKTLLKNQGVIRIRLTREVEEHKIKFELARREYNLAVERNRQREIIARTRAIVEPVDPQPNLIRIALRDDLGRRIHDSDGRVLWKDMVVLDRSGEPIINSNGEFVLLHGKDFNYLEPMSNGEMIATENNMQGRKRRIRKSKIRKSRTNRK